MEREAIVRVGSGSSREKTAIQAGNSPTLMVAYSLESGVVAWIKSSSSAAHQFGSAHVRAGLLTFTNTGCRAHGHR